jgi:hypothetical protein
METIWTYFEKKDKVIICLQCANTYKHCKNGGNSTLKLHLKNIHKIDIDKINNTNKVIDNIPEQTKDELNKNLILMFVKDNIQLRFVESKYFCKFVGLLNPSYKMLNRKQVKTHITDLFNTNFNFIKMDIQKNKSKFCISSDIWTDINRKSYLGLKLHYITEKFESKILTIAFKYIDNSHTGNNLSIIIKQSLQYFNVENIQSFTGDNCTNNIKCVEKLKETYNDIFFIGCFAHIINLIVQQGVIKENTLIIKVRNIIITIRNSSTLTNNLNNIANTNKITFYKPIQDVIIRWNSTYLMIDSFIKNKNVFVLLTETNLLTSNEWAELDEIQAILKPFYDLTKNISGSSYPTLGLCYSMTLRINNIISMLEKIQNIEIEPIT